MTQPMLPDKSAQLSLLDAIQENGRYTQRDLAGSTGMPLSYINRLLKDLVKKEWVNVKALNGKRFLYDLTPRGITEKAQLTLTYVLKAVDGYREIRTRVLKLCTRLKQEGKKRVVFCGAANEAEIVYLAALETGLEVLMIVDDKRIGAPWLHMRVEPLSALADNAYDHIIITDIERFEILVQELVSAGVGPEVINLCVGHRIKAKTTYHVVEG